MTRNKYHCGRSRSTGNSVRLRSTGIRPPSPTNKSAPARQRSYEGRGSLNHYFCGNVARADNIYAGAKGYALAGGKRCLRGNKASVGSVDGGRKTFETSDFNTARHRLDAAEPVMASTPLRPALTALGGAGNGRAVDRNLRNNVIYRRSLGSAQP